MNDLGASRRAIRRRYRIKLDWTGTRWGVIDNAKLPLVGVWCHSVHGSIASAMNWIARQR